MKTLEEQIKSLDETIKTLKLERKRKAVMLMEYYYANPVVDK